MIRHSTLAATAAAGLALAALTIGGCQSSGHAQASADANRPAMAAETSTGTQSTYSTPSASASAAVDASSYSVPYTAANDAPYMRSATETVSAGTLHSGDTVYLQSNAPTSGIVAAKTGDGRIVYVRAADLRAK
jgi:hypothetical protein